MNRARTAHLRALVSLAADSIASAWPLDTFVATNPLAGGEATTFEHATARARVLFRARSLPGNVVERSRREFVDAIGIDETLGDACSRLGWGDVVARVDERCSRWLAAYCDRGEATWPMPHRELGFYNAWKRLARHENALDWSGCSYLRSIDALPERAVDALLANLDVLEIPDVRRTDYLERHLAQCAGWAAYVKGLMENDREARIDLVALLAVRTWYERHEFARAARARRIPATFAGLHAWAASAPPSRTTARDASFDCVAHARAIAELEARERAYRDDLLDRIGNASIEPKAGVEAQFVFCIDARSEPLRRNLEATGPYETFGFAGFFGVPLQYRTFGADRTVAQAPVLVRPTWIVDERPNDAAGRALNRSRARNAARFAIADGVLSHPVTAFAGVEAFGLFAAARALLRTFAARREPERQPIFPLGLDRISAAERIFFAETALRMMGLTRDFAPTVVLCGHGGGTVNNAFAAALDCGACGGNRGLVNARVACLILNDPQVRLELDVRGVTIPKTTHFIAAEHDTTRDLVRFVLEEVPEARRESALALERTVNVAAARNRARRASDLPTSPLGLDDAGARAADWAQVRPEWGLARNAGFIVAPRALTRGVKLDGRCFLHSYDPAADSDGRSLEQILTAPLVVAQWINLHYFFATVDPQRFGSGDKVLQQPVGGFGVVLGNGGDLRLGLPLQSTTVGRTPYHEPLRLQAIVCAPTSRIDAIIARQTILQRLFDNRWVALVAIDPLDGVARRYTGKHTWLPNRSTEVVSCSQIA